MVLTDQTSSSSLPRIASLVNEKKDKEEAGLVNMEIRWKWQGVIRRLGRAISGAHFSTLCFYQLTHPKLEPIRKSGSLDTFGHYHICSQKWNLRPGPAACLVSISSWTETETQKERQREGQSQLKSFHIYMWYDYEKMKGCDNVGMD